MTKVFYRDVKSLYPKAVSAHGMYLTDSQGKQYLDMSGGAASASMGHGHPQVIEAMHRQIDQVAYAHSGFFTTDPQEQLAELITQQFQEANSYVYFSSGGSEANETALKMAWQYWRQKGQPKKVKIISREHSYHGNTLGALSVSGNLPRRRSMDNILLDWPRTKACYRFRLGAEHASEEAYCSYLIDELETLINKEGAETIAAFIAEPIVGASLGVVPAVEGYFSRVRDLCNAHSILLISDEVMCGIGRTGSYFAHQQEGVIPDMVTLGKGIASGYQPLAATLVREEIHQHFVQTEGFKHGHTYVGHATACAAGLAVHTLLLNEGVLENVSPRGEYFRKALKHQFSAHPHVGDIRGRGLMIGIEFVKDKDTFAPIEDAVALPSQIKKAAMNHGLICYPGGGSSQDGLSKHILLAPPYILEDRHSDEAILKIDRLLKDIKYV
ncbi:aspartate aminotransferase family protein [Temperatibacter marinus]|uniref:Aspartate aminotransferase family protein n=1 Tax=Temperatibacter marinus TaxID=1456591 RepID=A0AA52EH42_9PROT|nr:aspartate aminotransferase family protein [Temperatibacter marinus]WND02680.1 aspartate aminotransferase family protein [Temperatibacter marinus]